jgi:hypothetical protein
MEISLMLDIRLAGNEFTVALQAANAELKSVLCEDLAGALPDMLHYAPHIKDAFRPLRFELGITRKHDQRVNVLTWHEVQKLLNGLDVLVILT